MTLLPYHRCKELAEGGLLETPEEVEHLASMACALLDYIATAATSEDLADADEMIIAMQVAYSDNPDAFEGHQGVRHSKAWKAWMRAYTKEWQLLPIDTPGHAYRVAKWLAANPEPQRDP